jgi:hypothetical protein
VDIRSKDLLESRRVDYPTKTEAELTSLGVRRDINSISQPRSSNIPLRQKVINVSDSNIVDMSETNPKEPFRGVKDFGGYSKGRKIWMGKTVNPLRSVSSICTFDRWETCDDRLRMYRG